MNQSVIMIIGVILSITGVILTIWLINNDYIFLFPIGSVWMTVIGLIMILYCENDV